MYLKNNFFGLDIAKLEEQLRIRVFKVDQENVPLFRNMLVKTRDKKEMIVFVHEGKLQLVAINTNKINTYELKEWNDDLTHKSFNNLDIMEVFDINEEELMAHLLGLISQFNPISKWKRSEVKKVTVKELIDYYEKNNKCTVGILADMGK